MIEIVQGDCLEVFTAYLGRKLAGQTGGLGAIVVDPPAGINFMGRAWDQLPVADRKKALAREDAFSDYWAERLDVARAACVDDAVALIWALPRTVDLTMRAVRLAGWHIQDVIVHVFGQGWPKSRAALKPSQEMWILARKGSPVLGIDDCRVARGDSTARTQVNSGLGYGGGAIETRINGGHTAGSWPTNFVLGHAEGCRRAGMRKVRGSDPPTRGSSKLFSLGGEGVPPGYGFDGTETLDAWACVAACDCGVAWLALAGGPAPMCECGRPGWWACPVAEMDAQSGDRPSGARAAGVRKGVGYGSSARGDGGPAIESSAGGASRFFTTFSYYAKAPSGERHAGCEGLYWRADRKDPFGWVQISREEYGAIRDPGNPNVIVSNTRAQGQTRAQGNVHPTVKRLALMRWLHKLAAPKGPIGDLCGGSGSGAVAAYLDGYDWIGAEVCPQAITIAKARLAFWQGLTPSARDRFLAANEMPERPDVDPRQASLFGDL